MKLRASAMALGLGALCATPSLALTIQAAPPRPDVAQHLRSSSPAAPGVLPGPGQLQGSFVAPGRPESAWGSSAPLNGGTTDFGFGPVRGSSTLAPIYQDSWSTRGTTPAR